MEIVSFKYFTLYVRAWNYGDKELEEENQNDRKYNRGRYCE